jgi:hypothetical protein
LIASASKRMNFIVIYASDRDGWNAAVGER